MANTAHLIRRQSSRDLNPQRSVDRLEMKELRGRLMSIESVKSNMNVNYGATNLAYEDTSPNQKTSAKAEQKLEAPPESLKPVVVDDGPDKGTFRPEGDDERESWDSKLTFLLATIGYAVR